MDLTIVVNNLKLTGCNPTLTMLHCFEYSWEYRSHNNLTVTMMFPFISGVIEQVDKRHDLEL